MIEVIKPRPEVVLDFNEDLINPIKMRAVIGRHTDDEWVPPTVDGTRTAVGTTARCRRSLRKIVRVVFVRGKLLLIAPLYS